MSPFFESKDKSSLIMLLCPNVGPYGLCASVLGYSTADGSKVVAAKCHVDDRTPHHQNQEWQLDPLPLPVLGSNSSAVSAKNICQKSVQTTSKCTRSCLVRANDKLQLGPCTREAHAGWVIMERESRLQPAATVVTNSFESASQCVRVDG